MLRRGIAIAGLTALMWWPPASSAQQIADEAFTPPILSPAYAPGRGPIVLIDEAHHNFHTASGRYGPFAQLLRRDGYRVEGSRQPFTAEALRQAAVLVVANALHARNVDDSTLPTPSAFTDAEITALRDWVVGGGSLLLIADHMPMAGAAEALGAALGITWLNGFAMPSSRGNGPIVFARASGTLADHAITRDRTPGETVTSVISFTGSAFRAPAAASSILTLPEGATSLQPREAWQFGPDTPRVDVGGWSQGAVFTLGRGRVAVFGEAAMFTAQLAGPNRQPVGMNAPIAAQNAQFLLNVLHWLTPETTGR